MASRAYFLLFALLLDPLDIYNDRLRPQGWPEYNVSAGLFWGVLAALVVWTSFLTYHDLRKRVCNHSPEPGIPLYLACRWIARDSVWAANYNPALDESWVDRVDSELMSKVMMGRVELFGERYKRGSGARGPMQHIAPAFKEVAQWDSAKLVTEVPPTHMWAKGGDIYYGVMIDEKQLKRVWPRKSIWDRIIGRSPVERVGGYSYGGIFDKQDQLYRKKQGFTETPLEAIVA